MEIRKLNMLRGIAALIVVVSHYSNETRFLGGVLGDGAGQFGVMLFFILSGFLMAYLYLPQKFESDTVRNFAVARVARVVPLFVGIVLASLLLHHLGVPGLLYNIPDGRSLIAHFGLLSGDLVLWTIAPELQFYMLFVLFWYIRSKNIGILYFTCALLFFILLLLGFPNPTTTINGILLDSKLLLALPYFLSGMTMGQIYPTLSIPRPVQSDKYILTLLVLPLFFPRIFEMLFNTTHALWKDVSILVAVSLIFFAIVFLVPDNNPILANPLGDFLGKISYSLYLLHIPVLRLMSEPAKVQPGLFLLLFLAASLGISFLSYRFLENPARRIIRKRVACRSSLQISRSFR